MGLRRQPGRALCSPACPPGRASSAPRLRDEETGSFRPPAHPALPQPRQCHGATAVPAQSIVPPHDLEPSPSLLLLLPSGSQLGFPAGLGLFWGRGCTWGPLLGHPSLSFSRAHFAARSRLSVALCVAHQAGGSGQGFGPPVRRVGDLLEAALFSSAPSLLPLLSGAAISADPLTPPCLPTIPCL